MSVGELGLAPLIESPPPLDQIGIVTISTCPLRRMFNTTPMSETCSPVSQQPCLLLNIVADIVGSTTTGSRRCSQVSYVWD